MSDLHVVTTGDGIPALFVHGSMGWGLDTFSHQLPLGLSGYRVRLVDRRGFGASPDVGRVDFESDADDIAELLGPGTHLVGQSYGGVVAALAAARRPEMIRSLALIEPAFPSLVKDDEAVRSYLSRLEAVFSDAANLSPEAFWVRYVEAGGATVESIPSFSADDLRAVRSTMRERPFWEAELPVGALARLTCPKLVCAGGRTNASPEVRALGGQAWSRTCSAVATAIGADLVVFDDSAHNPQMEEPERFNAELLKFWRAAE